MRKNAIPTPAAPKSVLLALAGLAWFCVGAMLVVLACYWLSDAQMPFGYMYFGFGVAAALLIHHFGFRRIAAKNINRILSAPGKRCVFSFFAWKSYLLIIVMVTMGRLLRGSAFPKHYLSVLYSAIGLALVLSSLKYVSVFISEIRTDAPQDSSPSEKCDRTTQ